MYDTVSISSVVKLSPTVNLPPMLPMLRLVISVAYINLIEFGKLLLLLRRSVPRYHLCPVPNRGLNAASSL